MAVVVFSFILIKRKEQHITLNEVIPDARILSHEEGIIEYKGVQYILGTNNLKKRKRLIESLKLLDFESPCVVDLRFNTQIIIKRGSPAIQSRFGPGNM